MAELFTVRHALQHILGHGLADSIIADKGGAWAKVAAVADLQGREDIDHIGRWFLARLAWEQDRIDDGEYRRACEEFRQDHRQFAGSLCQPEESKP